MLLVYGAELAGAINTVYYCVHAEMKRYGI
jgi:hypothetical protein